MRESDPDATIYWLVRMLEAGEDPLYVARRIVRFASEDIGLADPRALRVALDAKDAFDFLGMPEGSLALAEAAGLLRPGAEVQRPLRGRGRGQARRRRKARRAGAGGHPQRRDEAHARGRIRQGLSLRSGRARGRRRNRVPARIGLAAAGTTGLGPRARKRELSKRLEAVLKLRQEKWAQGRRRTRARSGKRRRRGGVKGGRAARR